MSSIYTNPGDAVVQIPDLQYRAGKKHYPLSFSPGETKDLETIGFTAAEVKASGQLAHAVKTGLLNLGKATVTAPKPVSKTAAVAADGTVTPKTAALATAETEDLTKMTKKQLIALAQSRGIDVDEKLPNRELIKLLTEAAPAAPPATE